MHKSLYGYRLSFLLGEYLRVEWLGSMLSICLTLRN